MGDPKIDGSIGIIPDEEIENKRLNRKRRRRIRVLVALSLVLLIVVAAGIWYWRQHLAAVAKICSGLEETSGDGYALSKVEDECVGWTAERNFAFSPDIADVTTKITDLNKEVGKRWSASEHGRSPIPYVRVAALMPMTSDASSAMSTDTIRRSLEGIYAAQARANDLDRQDFRSPNSVGIQVVLANEGKQATQWPRVVDQLVGMSTGDHPVVAAVGLGISIPEAKAAATTLSQNGIISIGGVITATDMVADRFFKVSPSNVDYASALDEYVKTRPDLKSGFLVYDTNDDNFTRTLQAALDNQFGEKYHLGTYRRAFAGSKKPHPHVPPATFSGTVNSICAAGTDVVFYAGRERDLPALIGALAARTCNPLKPITIAVGATGLGRTQGDPEVVATLQKAQLSVVNASSTAPQEWGSGRNAPDGYRAFHEYFTGKPGAQFAEEELLDGYAIMHHDAFATAAWAIRLAAEEKPGEGGPEKGGVVQSMINMHGNDAIRAASGTLSFSDRHSGWPQCKTVPIVHVPHQVAPDDVYLTKPCEDH